MKLSALLQRLGFLGFLLSDTFKAEFHLNIPWWIIASATTALIWWLTHRGIQLSARIATIMGALEVIIMLALELHVCYIRARGLLILRH